MLEGRGGKMVLGMGLLHLVCCGLPLVLAAGALGGAGALLGVDVTPGEQRRRGPGR